MPFSFINWEKSCTCWSSCRSTCVISAFIVRASRKSRAFTHAECAKCIFRPIRNMLSSRVCMNRNSYPQHDVNHDIELKSLNCAFSYGVILVHSDIKLNPQHEVSHDVEWRCLNYAFSYGVILVQCDIKLIPTTWSKSWCWIEVSELCLQLVV